MLNHSNGLLFTHIISLYGYTVLFELVNFYSCEISLTGPSKHSYPQQIPLNKFPTLLFCSIPWMLIFISGTFYVLVFTGCFLFNFWKSMKLYVTSTVKHFKRIIKMDTSLVSFWSTIYGILALCNDIRDKEVNIIITLGHKIKIWGSAILLNIKSNKISQYRHSPRMLCLLG